MSNHSLPEIGFVRLPQILAVFPVGKTCWMEGVRTGRYPKPVKLSERCIAWRVEDIQNLIQDISQKPDRENVSKQATTLQNSGNPVYN